MKSGFPHFAMLFALLVVTVPQQTISIFRPSPNRIESQSNRLQVTQTGTPPTNTPSPTNTPNPTSTNTPQPTATSSGSFIRPQIGVQNYRTNPVHVQYGEDFKLFVRLRNEGHAHAYNVQVSFTSADFIPLKNGGVNIVGDLVAGNSDRKSTRLNSSHLGISY